MAAADPGADPFGEQLRSAGRVRARVLGGEFRFESSSRALLRLVTAAYAGLPAHRLWAAMPSFNLRLVLASDREAYGRAGPPPLKTFAGGGLLCGTLDAANFAVLSPRERSGVVVISRGLCAYPYHARYELIEFAVFTLASRARQLMALHAACVGRAGRGVLLMGDSGAGKSTLALQCLLDGWEFVSEDSTFVAPRRGLATGVANFLHLQAHTLRFVADRAERARLRAAPTIRRRSGVSKLEIDVRTMRYRIANKPLRVCGTVVLSEAAAGARPLLRRLGGAAAAARLAACQPYAAGQPGWALALAELVRRGVWELRRGRHPAEAAAALRSLVAA